jgi:hypothetical protein
MNVPGTGRGPKAGKPLPVAGVRMPAGVIGAPKKESATPTVGPVLSMEKLTCAVADEDKSSKAGRVRAEMARGRFRGL